MNINTRDLFQSNTVVIYNLIRGLFSWLHSGYNYVRTAISPGMVARRQTGPEGFSPSFLAPECHMT